MVNLSLTKGVFVDLFKQAIVTPLIKKPSLAKDDLKNYRPDFLMDKLFEGYVMNSFNFFEIIL